MNLRLAPDPSVVPTYTVLPSTALKVSPVGNEATGFALPAASGCGPFGVLNPIVNWRAKVPATSGTSLSTISDATCTRAASPVAILSTIWAAEQDLAVPVARAVRPEAPFVESRKLDAAVVTECHHRCGVRPVITCASGWAKAALHQEDLRGHEITGSPQTCFETAFLRVRSCAGA